MKVLIRDVHKTVSVNIYGLDGQIHTKDFFDRYMQHIEGVYPTDENEKNYFNSEAEWTFDTMSKFEVFAKVIEKIQKNIEDISYQMTNGKTIEDFTYMGECYVI